MRAQKNTQPLTTAQRLSSIVKSCRDIMRKDKGLNGDLDRLPMLTWIMFLKFLDDMEQIAEQGLRLIDRSADVHEELIPRLPADEQAVLGIRTYYESMWLEEGKKIRYVRFALT